MVMSAYSKDIIRTVRGGMKRLLAMAVIAMLGVTMMTGLKAACDDTRNSADSFFDSQRLHDISVVSTLGLTEEDVEALRGLDGVEDAGGAYSETVQIEFGDGSSAATVSTFTEGGIDEPYVVSGRLPAKVGEIAVTSQYLNESGKQVGDTVTITEETDGDTEDDSEEDPNFPVTEYTIVGEVIDVTSVVNPEGSTSFRSTGSDNYHCFVTTDSVNADYYTAVNIIAAGAAGLDTFSDEYETLISNLRNLIQNELVSSREQARYDQVTGDAWASIEDARTEMEEAFADAEAELASARTELDDGWASLEAGEAEYNSGVEQLESARAQLAEAKAELNANRAQLESSQAELNSRREQLDASQSEINSQREQLDAGQSELNSQREQLDAKQAELNSQREQLDASQSELNLQREQLDAQREELIAMGMTEDMVNEQLAEHYAKLDAGQTELDGYYSELNAGQSELDGYYAELDAGQTELAGYYAKLDAGQSELAGYYSALEAGQSELNGYFAQLESGEADLNAAEQQLNEQAGSAEPQLAAARAQLDAGRQELLDGEASYNDGLEEYRSERADAEAELSDAEEEIDDIDECSWYLRSRTSLDGWADIKSDADSIESIGTIFPVMFILVAILISLTTMTRMVDENRGLIGTYQALGFTDREIAMRFVIFSGAASLLGGILGNLFGFIVLPKIIFIIFKTMYLLPEFALSYNALYGFGGIALFFVAIVGVTLYSCLSTVRQVPAVLMRPKAPKSGTRILLEHIKPIWRRMSFLNKVTARNLFRYKKRLIMTVVGIAGCTGLLLCGFSVRDSVSDLMPKQYDHIISYDILAATAGGDDNERMMDYISGLDEAETYLNLMVTTVDVYNSSGETLSVQIYVIPDGTDISDYFSLTNLNGSAVTVSGDGLYASENIGIVLDVQPKDTIRIQDMALNEAQVQIEDEIVYYLGNAIFMSESGYEAMFGDYEPNAAVIRLTDNADEAEIADALKGMDEVVSVSSVQELRDTFSQAFALMNMVVYVIIVLAGALAFVVLFTLASTNISERERELATIKVLGFRDGEVHLYVNKETMILTVIGILCGMPLGYALGKLLGAALIMPAFVYSATVNKSSFVIAGAITFIFALIVQQITNRTLNGVDPIEALKSIE